MGDTDQYRKLKPADVISTLKSLPRRLRDELFTDTNLDIEALAGAKTRRGASAIEAITTSAPQIERHAQLAYRASLDTTAPPPKPSPAPPATVRGALEVFDEALRRSIDELVTIPASGWARNDALAHGQDAARAGVAVLHTVAAILDELAPHRLKA